MTFDRFAWELTSRWRCRLRELDGPRPSELDYDGTCQEAAQLLADEVIAKWARARYPVVLVDEFQDCRTGRLGIVTGLAPHVELLVAADEFQDLEERGSSSAVEWLRSVVDPEELNLVHRTADAGLLAAATALRNGTTLVDAGNIKVFAAPNANVAASYLARGIAWGRGEEVVVVSATTAERSPFVRATLARLAEKPFVKDGKKYGPYAVAWEQSRGSLEHVLADRLSLPEELDASIPAPQFSDGSHLPGQRELEHWIETRRRLEGDRSFQCGELRTQIHRVVQRLRSRPRTRQGLRAVTIHQAKNREFERVFVLWSVEIGGDPEMQRRLLYNAVTRAKKAVTILVQDPKPKNSRLKSAPFFR